MSAHTPFVSVLLATYRQPDALIATIRDLARQEYPSEKWELIVVDDGSRDASAIVAAAAVPSTVNLTIRRLRSGGCYSHASLFNQMLHLSDPGSEVYVHIEDVRARPDLLRQHSKWHRDGKWKVLVTGPMCEGSTETFDPTTCSRWQLMRMSGVESTAFECCFQAVFAKSMSYSRALREALTLPGAGGPFDASMTGWGYHETEFALRAEQAGATCIYDVSCGVFHPAHHERDEATYREIDRAATRTRGTELNVRYLCQKHGIEQLPNWRVGVPIRIAEW